MHYIGVDTNTGLLCVIDDKMVRDWAELPNGEFYFECLDDAVTLNSDMIIVEGQVSISFDITKGGEG